MVQRQRRRSQSNLLPQVIFLCLTFAAAVGGTFFALRLFGAETSDAAVPQIITVEIIITTTPPPTRQAAPPVNAARPQVELPADIAAEADGAPSAAINADQLGAQNIVLSTPTVSVAGGPEFSQNCYHSVVTGDTPYGLALRYGVDAAVLLDINDLTVETATRMQVGDILRVPKTGCQFDGLAIEDLVSATAAPTATSTPVVAEFELVSVSGLGDITAEAIRLRNLGAVLNMSGWTLSDADGNHFTFRETMLFPQGTLIVYSRSGTSTSDARFWGLEEPIWQAGETMTISDEKDRVLQTLEIPPAAGS